MITVSGRVVDETGAALPGLIVESRANWNLTKEKVARAKTSEKDLDKGTFTLEVPNPSDVPSLARVFRFRVIDFTLRPLTRDRELDGAKKTHDLGDVIVQRADLKGLLVTNLTGVPLYVSDGNALKLLIDGEEAFPRIADDIRAATESISMTQLFFPVPEKFQSSERDEKPSLIFKFLEPSTITPVDPLLPNQQPPPTPVPRTFDDRPERLILDEALTHELMTARILLNEPTLGWPAGILGAFAGVPLGAGLGVSGLGAVASLIGVGIPYFPIVFGALAVGLTTAAWIKIAKYLLSYTNVDELTDYFRAALENAPPAQHKIKIRGFRQAVPDHGVMHCKMVIVDGKRAVVTGSPFEQGYFDGPIHKIDNPQRGNHTGAIYHDASIAVVGPAVHDLHEAMQLFWNEDLDINSRERIKDIPFPEKETGGEDGVATVQVVQTLSATRFKQLDKRSEKGILESYLRAFAVAKTYIYLETQYFTEAVIADALIEVLKQQRDVEVILMLNLKPDVNFYPHLQADLVDRIRKAGGERVGVFTRWSYDANTPNNGRPRVAHVYLHSKLGIVDDSWATIGSANLDGLSLNSNTLLSPFVFGEATATELNLSIIPKVTGEVTPVVELLRRRLFAEHLGLLDAKGNPNPLDSRLDTRPANGWVKGLWKLRAAAALQHLKEARRTGLDGFVLEYPPGAGCLTTPRKHLAKLGVPDIKDIPKSLVRPISSMRGFDFSTGKWCKKREREDFDVTTSRVCWLVDKIV